VKKRIREQLHNRKRRIERRLDKADNRGCHRPMFTARDIYYEIAERTRGIASGGIGAIHALARQVGLIEAIDDRLELLKLHFPYHESDHVLNFAYNALSGGTCLEDLELRRTDEVFLDALGARRLPDPTTAGDFCRRFNEETIRLLQDIVHDVRIGVWAKQPDSFFDRAVIDMDGILVETTGQCKQGMDIAYNGTWGYHPLVLSLANTGEVLGLVNRSGNRPSHDGAAAEVDRALAVCFKGGFRKRSISTVGTMTHGCASSSALTRCKTWWRLLNLCPSMSGGRCNGRCVTKCTRNRGSGRTTSKRPSSSAASSRTSSCARNK
jgi:Transposase DDE domain group 1